MEVYIPFGSINGDRKYRSSDLAALYASVLTDGIHPGIANCLQVVSAGGWNITIKPGVCQIQGRWGKNTADCNMTLEVTNGSQDRIDAIVMRCDYQTRMISETIKKGAYASSPVAPALQRDANAYEICLAQIRVSKTATSITQANITDTRQNSSLCGIINSLITVNPDGLFMQFQSEWNNFFSDVQDSTTEWLSEQQQTFEDWFGTIEDMLDDNQASQMAGQIAAINSSIAALQAETVVASATSLLVPAASWSKIGALWSANIAIPTYDGIYSPIVCFGNADALFGDLLNFCNGSNGVVTIYSNRIVTRDITIPLIYWVHDN